MKNKLASEARESRTTYWQINRMHDQHFIWRGWKVHGGQTEQKWSEKSFWVKIIQLLTWAKLLAASTFRASAEGTPSITAPNIQTCSRWLLLQVRLKALYKTTYMWHPESCFDDSNTNPGNCRQMHRFGVSGYEEQPNTKTNFKHSLRTS